MAPKSLIEDLRQEEITHRIAEAVKKAIGPGLVVLEGVGGTTKTSSGKEAAAEFGSIVGKRLPLVETPDLAVARKTLVGEFPHCEAAIDAMLADLVGRKTVKLSNWMLAGDSGSGKSRLSRRLPEVLGLEVIRYDGAGASDSTFSGTPRRWSSGEPSVPLEAVRRSMSASPCIVIDEAEKSGTSRHNGALTAALLPFLEQETAKWHVDPYVQFPCDLSMVSYILTVNDPLLLPKPLRDRLKLLHISMPGPEHLAPLAYTIVKEIAGERGIDSAWAPGLGFDEFEIAGGLWKGGSIRRLRDIIERILARRDKTAIRN